MEELDEKSIAPKRRWIAAAAAMVPLYYLFLMLGVLLAFIFIGLAAFATGQPMGSFSDLNLDDAAQLAGQALAALVGFLIYRRLSRGCAAVPGMGRAEMLRTVALVVAVGFAMQFLASSLLTLVATLTPAFNEMYAPVNEALSSTTLLATIGTCVGAPFAEELMFRGVALPLARRGTRAFWAANAIQALLFGIVHMNLIQGAYAFGFGLLLGLVYVRTGRLWMSILLHCVMNTTRVLPNILIVSLFGEAAQSMVVPITAVMGLVSLVVTVPLVMRVVRMGGAPSDTGVAAE